MKNLIMAILATTILVLALSAQDKVDPRRLFNKATDTLINSNINEFAKGWNWGTSGRKLDEALNINYLEQ